MVTIVVIMILAKAERRVRVFRQSGLVELTDSGQPVHTGHRAWESTDETDDQ